MFAYFFTYVSDIPPAFRGRMFSSAHLLGLLLLLISWIVLILVSRKRTEAFKWRFLTVIIMLLPILEALRIVWFIGIGHFSWGESLPFHLCGLMSIILPILAFTKSRFLMEYAWAMGLAPALMALITPDVADYPPLSFAYIQTFILHGIICFVPLFLVFGMGFRPDFRKLPKLLGLVGLMALVMIPINLITGGNYLFLCRAPKGTPLALFDQFVGWPWYLLPTLALAFILWGICYMPFTIIRRKAGPCLKEESIKKAG